MKRSASTANVPLSTSWQSSSSMGASSQTGLSSLSTSLKATADEDARPLRSSPSRQHSSNSLSGLHPLQPHPPLTPSIFSSTTPFYDISFETNKSSAAAAATASSASASMQPADPLMSTMASSSSSASSSPHPLSSQSRARSNPSSPISLAIRMGFPSVGNSKVFITHLWVMLNFWLCGGAGRKFDRRAIFIPVLLLAAFALFSSGATGESTNAPPTPEPFNATVKYFPEPPPPIASFTAAVDSNSANYDSKHDEDILRLDSGYSPNGRSLPSLAEDSLLDDGSQWDTNRKYGIVIDAGSSGSRILVYSWRDPRRVVVENEVTRMQIPTIDRADEHGKNWTLSITPGLSTLSSNPTEDAVADYVKPLFQYALSVIPRRKVASTPMYLLATAGMRLISVESRALILNAACRVAMSSEYGFSVAGGCEKQFRVISGQLEGLFGWVAANYLKGTFDLTTSSKTFGFLDMGGASTQIAFEPNEAARKEHFDDLSTIRLRTAGGYEMSYHVFSATFLGFGVNEARRRYVESLNASSRHLRRVDGPYSSRSGSSQDRVNGFERLLNGLNQRSAGREAENYYASSSGSPEIVGSKLPANNANVSIPDPCLPLGHLVEDSRKDKGGSPPYLLGTGSLDQCMATILPILNKAAPCPDEPCFFNSIHGPLPHFSDGQLFIAASEYFYTPSSFHDDPPLTPHIDTQRFSSLASSHCSTPWAELVSQHPGVDIQKLGLQCFKSAWLLTVLHEGFGLPRVSGGSAVLEAVDELEGFPMSWTLGAMLMHVSSTVAYNAVLNISAGSAGRLWAKILLVVLLLFMFGAAGLVAVVKLARTGAGTMSNGNRRMTRRSSKPTIVSSRRGYDALPLTGMGEEDLEAAGPSSFAGGRDFVGDFRSMSSSSKMGVPLTRVGVGVALATFDPVAPPPMKREDGGWR